MPAIKNVKWERYCQNLAAGMSMLDAYKGAGFKPDRGNASRLQQKDNIARRVAEILEKRELIDSKATEKAIEKLAITKEAVIAEIAKIAFSNASDFFEWGPDGVKIKPSSELTTDQLSVVSEVQETRAKGHGESTIKIKLSDKQSALEKLGRHFGAFRDKVELTGKDGQPLVVNINGSDANL